MKVALAVLSLVLPLAAHAASTTAVLDAGGRHATSAKFANDGSVGGWGGIAGSSVAVARHGYAGQLTELAGVAINATPATIPEGGTRQLSARANQDDGSSTSLAATSVAWGLVSGPITSVSTAGVATASMVYQDTQATVRGVYQVKSGTVTLTVSNTGSDDFGAYAGDGLDDAWQVQYFGLGAVNAGPAVDPDGDGQDNRLEWAAGTVPTNAASRLQLMLSRVPGAPTSMSLGFSPCYTNRTYELQASGTLAPGSFVSRASLKPSANAAEAALVDTNAVAPKGFYRLSITPGLR